MFDGAFDRERKGNDVKQLLTRICTGIYKIFHKNLRKNLVTHSLRIAGVNMKNEKIKNLANEQECVQISMCITAQTRKNKKFVHLSAQT